MDLTRFFKIAPTHCFFLFVWIATNTARVAGLPSWQSRVAGPFQ
jgi:hypothetical protein